MMGLSLPHQAGWWVAACCGLAASALLLYAVALVGLIVIGQGSGADPALFQVEPLTATGGAPDTCALEDGDMLADTVYLPVPVLSCWDSAWNLRVVSPERVR
jgi:hypothetical protein